MFANPLLPSTLLVSGLVYDVATGTVSIIDGPRPLRNDAESAGTLVTFVLPKWW
jgi:hypothetical protein